MCISCEIVCVVPVVEDAVDHQPLHFDAIAVKLLLHVDKERILVLPLGAFDIVTITSEIHRGRFVHVSLPLVVTEHHLAVQLQLRTTTGKSEYAGPFGLSVSCAYVREVHGKTHILNYRWIQFQRVCGTCSSSTQEQCQ